jgi:galactokinase
VSSLRNSETLSATTPGRICLFGEHQDYLELPVIAAAISLIVCAEGKRTTGKRVRIALPDLSTELSFDIDQTLPYVTERDYLRSGVNVLKRNGFSFSAGIACEIRSNIPINAGTSSSSALTVSWIHLLTQLADHPRDVGSEQLARWAHEAEVAEFNEPGGMMDHYSTAMGGILYLQFFPALRATPLHPSLGTFVLGDSLQEKDTKGILAGVKNVVLEIERRLRTEYPEFSLHTARTEDLDRYRSSLQGDQRALVRGTLRNRLLTHEALALLSLSSPVEEKFGELLNQHQAVLRDVLKISTPKIDRMLDAALAAGAVGGKINGSGGGGCMFAYAPHNAERIAEAIEREGGRAYIVSVSAGTSVTRGGSNHLTKTA